MPYYVFVISLCVALCEENPTRLAISAVIGLTGVFVPVVTTQPEPDKVDSCVQKETLVQDRDVATLGSKEEELLRKSKIGPVGKLVHIRTVYVHMYLLHVHRECRHTCVYALYVYI